MSSEPLESDDLYFIGVGMVRAALAGTGLFVSTILAVVVVSFWW